MTKKEEKRAPQPWACPRWVPQSSSCEFFEALLHLERLKRNKDDSVNGAKDE